MLPQNRHQTLETIFCNRIITLPFLLGHLAASRPVQRIAHPVRKFNRCLILSSLSNKVIFQTEFELYLCCNLYHMLFIQTLTCYEIPLLLENLQNDRFSSPIEIFEQISLLTGSWSRLRTNVNPISCELDQHLQTARQTSSQSVWLP